MTDHEIIALINAHIADYAQEMRKYKCEMTALLALKKEIQEHIDASLDHQAGLVFSPAHVTNVLAGRDK